MTESANYAFSLCGLSKTFRGKRGVRVEALKQVSLSISQGEVFGFLGPNGAGKSTTIKCLMGLIKPTSGTASVFGEPAGSLSARQHIGYLPENPAFFDYLSADEYLGFVGRTFKMDDAVLQRRKEEVLALLDLLDARKRPIRGYSKGMVQRLGIAQVLLHNPDVYILDEPMSGLDPLGRALVKNIILDLKKQGKCVFFSTHITSDVESICDRVGIILKGELKRVDKVDTILSGGIHGYIVRVKNSVSGSSSEQHVRVEELSQVLASEQNSGNEIILVEPQRTNLEDFFLNIVKGP